MCGKPLTFIYSLFNRQTGSCTFRTLDVYLILLHVSLTAENVRKLIANWLMFLRGKLLLCGIPFQMSCYVYLRRQRLLCQNDKTTCHFVKLISHNRRRNVVTHVVDDCKLISSTPNFQELCRKNAKKSINKTFLGNSANQHSIVIKKFK